MLMVAHAVILDEWSVGLLWHRLLRHYDGAPGQPTGGFPEYAELLRRRGIGDAFISHDVPEGQLRDFLAAETANSLAPGAASH